MMTAAIDEARTALKTFFEAERTLKLGADGMTRVAHLTVLQGLRDRLCEASYLGIVVLNRTEELLEYPCVYLDVEQRRQADKLRDTAEPHYQAWLNEFRKANTERATLAVLDAIASFVVPPLPSIPSE
jgi:hypothetical protein